MSFVIRSAAYVIRRIRELCVIGSARLVHFLRGGYAKGDEPEYAEFRADFSKFDPEIRMEGVSGFYRVKNEEKFLRASVEAHLPYLDEIVIVYNDCTDRTPEVADMLAREHPDKVKTYHYRPRVHTALSREHIITPARSVHSLVNYYNYALSKTTRKIAVKIDADHIPVLPQFADAVAKIRAYGLTTMRYFFGVNVYMQNGAVCVNTKKPFTHGYDCGFFPISRRTRFVHRQDSESLALPLRMYVTRTSLGVLFYHLKGFKDDYGYGNLDIAGDLPESLRQIAEPHLVSWQEARGHYADMLADVPEPELSSVQENMLRSVQ